MRAIDDIVVAEATELPVSVEEFKQHARIDYSTDDALVEHYVKAAAEHLRKHHTQALNVSHLADMVGLSVAQFERQFRKVYELSPRQMHTQARIQAATQWLAQPLSVAQVAQHCGYTDHSAFARQFRATVGMTPSQYRELQRRGRMAMRAAARDAQLRQQAQAPQRPLPAQAATPANPLHNPGGTGYWAD